MSENKLTMLDMEKLANSLNLANENLIQEKENIEDEFKDVMKNHRAKLRQLFKTLIDKRATLLEAIKDNPELFASPKTQTFSGIKFGITKNQATFKYQKDDVQVALIEQHFPDDKTLINITKKPNKNGIKQLSDEQLKTIKVKKTYGKNSPSVDIAVTDVEKIIKSILTDVEKQEKNEK